ncbi:MULTISPECIES: HU family DNA-binding protein [Parabacteroides]|uniref:HU family DNA-binding protein n=1 Tax=Parabacteroides TaxID=375288 RepID=UPI000EFF708E|nr:MULTISPECIES: HU family DNA-binding protein [Parabacteroides]RHU30711.1 HU family DNA-binding protein [Parabacteroides sp. TM07-1AC]WFE84060.1 HU family DNA-binding protein [Parabacteroides chongii]
MNKQQLINELTLQTGFTRTTVQKVFESLTGIITNELKQGGEIRLQGFAILSRWHQPERPARNPKTGTPHTIPARFSVKLKPGKQLLDELNNTQTKNK